MKTKSSSSRLGPERVAPPLPFRTQTGPRGCSHNPQYLQARVPALDHAGNPQGLRDADVGRLLRGAVPAPGCLPESEGRDTPGKLPVLRGPRIDDAPGGPRVPGARTGGRTGLVDPVRPEQIPGPRARGGRPGASRPAVRERRWSRGARDHRRVTGP